MRLGDAIQRLQRTVAQRGLRNALSNIWRRLRSGDFTVESHAMHLMEGSHPFDEATGLDTAGFIHGRALRSGHPNDLYSVSYYGSAPSLVQQMLERWQATPGTRPVSDYSFIDYGSGKGRVVMLASEHPFLRCIGVELNPDLHDIARSNLQKWQTMGRAQSPTLAVQADATEYVPPPTPCLVYLFNPFTSKVLAALVAKLATVFRDRPGELDVLYVNAEFDGLFAAHPGFEKLWSMPVQMSEEDAAVDLLYLNEENGSRQFGTAGTEPCSGWRWVGVK